MRFIVQSLPHPTNDLGVEKPDGGAVGPEYWTLARGDQNHILRAVFAAPAGQPAVGDLLISGEKITYGGQIVKAGSGLKVKLTGVVGNSRSFSQPYLPLPGRTGRRIAQLQSLVAPGLTRMAADEELELDDIQGSIIPGIQEGL